ncbi:MAG TPA: hypothetical protein VLJ42_03855 [Solirubrobacteraceae bacterium]|nr:hypothetical protein [Solirubrobacteraceae bacterium]
MSRLLTSLATFSLLLLLTAPTALAENDGRGFYGVTDDKVITNGGFILIFAIPLFLFLMSMLHHSLDKRKEARDAAHKGRAENSYWRGGW